MSISKADVAAVARLAHLDPDAATLEDLTRDLGAILDYMACLAEAEREAGRESAEDGSPATPFREDAVRPGLAPGVATAVAPAASGDLFRVPPAIGGDSQEG